MIYNEEYERNQQAYRALRATIDQSFPIGRYVALYGGKVAADAARLEDLLQMLRSQGKDPMDALVVQAGDEMPDYVDILTQEANR